MYRQVTIFPVVCFYKCTSGCENLKRESLVFCFTNDLSPDAHMVQVCMPQVLQHLTNVLCVKKVIMVSNSCAAQFKSKLPFLFLLHTDVPDQAVSIKKVFFGSCHGKNDSDWLGGSVKRAVTTDVAKGKVYIYIKQILVAVPGVGGDKHHAVRPNEPSGLVVVQHKVVNLAHKQNTLSYQKKQTNRML